MAMEYFKNNPQGVLVATDNGVDETVHSVWFPYTKSFVNEIKVGNFVAVKNYSGADGNSCFSILEIVTAYPKHYALGTSASDTEKAFPGFVIEAAKNAKIDWEQTEPIEQTTKIKAEAISTGLQLTVKGKEETIEFDQSLPMVGEDAHLLTDELTNLIVNGVLLTKDIPTISPCNLILNEKIEVKLSVEDLLKTHFGIFGFTGAGKSNMLSTMISHLIKDKGNNKIILFDLATEYSGLLIDLIHSNEEAYILCLDEESLPGSDDVRKYVIEGDKNKLDLASESITKTLLLPKDLISYKNKYTKMFKELLTSNKIRVYSTGSDKPTRSQVASEASLLITGTLGNNDLHLRKLVEEYISGSSVEAISEDEIKALLNEISESLKVGKIQDYTTEPQNQSLVGSQKPVRGRTITLTATGRNVLVTIQDMLKKYSSQNSKIPLPKDSILTLSDIYTKSSDKSKPLLIVIQSNRDDNLRDFSADLVNYIFSIRKRRGEINPHTIFLYDEADEFIPSTGKDSYARSLDAATSLARRGRKLGMGIGFATQRVAYLNTSILAQPHTFFLSKLPREYDRKVIGEAFGVSDKMTNRTLSFLKGQWMLFSYDATGLTNTPLLVKFLDANKRIADYLSSH